MREEEKKAHEVRHAKFQPLNIHENILFDVLQKC